MYTEGQKSAVLALWQAVPVMDDAQLLSGARRGDQAAFTSLVERYQDQLFTMALRLSGSAPDAADVVQETFTRAFTHLHDLRGDTLKAWLYRVATNCVRDLQRKRGRRPETPLEQDGKIVDMPDAAASPELDAIARETSAMVKRALQELPLDSRTVLVLRDINDLSYPEIADVLRCPLGTVKSRISRARGQMLEQLRRDPAFASEYLENRQ